jgi:hypothetical protein
MTNLLNNFRLHRKLLLLLVSVLLTALTPLLAYAGIGEFFYNNIVLPLFGMLVGWSAIILNWSINEFVIGFGNQFSGGIGTVVDNTWSVARDIFNLTFIFGLVYIGFKMILGTDSSETRRWLINIVIAALLVNFSLFITKFVVDVSNITAVEILNFPGAFVENPPGEVDFAGSLMQPLQTITIVDQQKNLQGQSDDIGFSVIFATMLLFIVTAFVFMSAGILLIVRAAVLIVLMILSPFLFIGMVLPMFRGLARSLWRRLFSNAFVAPIYIFFIYLTLQILGGIGPSGSLGSISPSSVNASDPNFVAGIGASLGPFIIATVATGKRLEKYGRRQMGNATLGGAAYAGRKVGGGVANKAAQSKTLRRLATSDSKYGKYIARPAGQAALRSADKVAGASFDARNVAGLGAATGLGTGKKGGFRADVEAKTKRNKEMMDLIGTRDMDDQENQAERVKLEKEMENRATQADEFKKADSATVGAEVQRLQAEINRLKSGKKADGSDMSDAEKAEAKVEQEKLKQALETTKAIQTERQAIENLATTIKTTTDPNQKANMQAELTKREIGLEQMGDTYRERGADSENQIKYKDQLGYMKSLEDGAKMKQGVADLLSGKAAYDALFKGGSGTKGVVNVGTVAGTGGAAATPWVGAGATAGAGATVGAGAVMTGAAYQDRLALEQLKKDMGSNARQMADQDKKNKNRKDLGQAFQRWQSENSDPRSSTNDTSASNSTETDDDKTT